MDPQQELHPLTSSVIGGSPINYSKKLLLRNRVHGMVPWVSAKD